MLDISLFRDDTTVEQIRESERKRFRTTENVDLVVESDKLWRQATFNRAQCSRVANIINRLIGSKKRNNEFKPNEDSAIPSEIMYMQISDVRKDTLEQLTVEQLKAYSQQITEREKQYNQDELDHLDARNIALENVGNLLNPDVPVSETEDDNGLIKLVITPSEFESDPSYVPLTHDVLLQKIGGVDYKAGQRVAGNRGYYLRGPAVSLAQALIQVSLKILGNYGYEPVQTPFFMKHEVLEKVSQLNDFSDRLYRVDQGFAPNQNAKGTFEDDGNATYLIATSEQPLVALNQDQKFNKLQLPIRYAGISTCFRTETGRHGQDTAGICRVHQFDKIEQFVITDPNTNSENGSPKMMEEMIRNCEELLHALNISYRIVSIVSKELNLAAAIKYDIEGLFPGSSRINGNQSFRELVSCSNCTDYQSRAVNVQFANSTGPADRYVHMLNSTMCAVPRMISVLLESNQTAKGIHVPEILRPYMPDKYKEFISYVE